jgi:predicted 3-demethylubiquinone-9 3-methyltransferase (glyoxalase superfamily)
MILLLVIALAFLYIYYDQIFPQSKERVVLNKVTCIKNDCKALVNYLDIKSKCDAICGDKPIHNYKKNTDNSITCECETKEHMDNVASKTEEQTSHELRNARVDTNKKEQYDRYKKLIFG